MRINFEFKKRHIAIFLLLVGLAIGVGFVLASVPLASKGSHEAGQIKLDESHTLIDFADELIAIDGQTICTAENSNDPTSSCYDDVGGGGAGLWSPSGDDIYYTGGGVGIGTDNIYGPALLHIAGVNNPFLWQSSPDTGYGVEAAFELSSLQHAGLTIVRANANYDNIRGNAMVFETRQGGGGGMNTNQLYLDKDGDVGIGSGDPVIGLAIGDSDTGLQQQGDGELAIFTNNVERVRIDQDGNVGIGTDTPDSKLEVVGGISSEASVAVSGTGVHRDYYNAVGVHGALSGVAYGVWGDIAFEDTSGNLYGGYFNSRDYGVHSSTPVGGWDFYAAGAGQDYGSSSSIRWKRNIKPIDNALDKVSNLRGVYFDWDKEHGGNHDMGMIAEEVGKYVPEIVSYEKDGVYATGMDYGRLTPVLVEAIKEQQIQIEELKDIVCDDYPNRDICN